MYDLIDKMKDNRTAILGIESSCDDTAAAVCLNGQIVSNIVANQDIHAEYGGVVPELASRAHLSNIIPTIHGALGDSGVELGELSAVAVTTGPGLMGSLVVGLCAARGISAGLGIPLISVNHMDAHIMSCFIEEPIPSLPFLCLTVSGGHTQLTIVNAANDMSVIGRTRDDAAGEAFDKVGKLIGLPYPAGPHIDRLARSGEECFSFTKASIPNYDFSFSGLKTQVMYFLRDEQKKDPEFLDANRANIAASVSRSIVDMLLEKLVLAATNTGIKSIGIAGGVSANSLLRQRVKELAGIHQWDLTIPAIRYCTDNAAMIAIAGYHKYLAGDFSSLKLSPFTKSI